ncbi:hypothetical protein BU26DRAFT_561754 [Trematosphaeria pertusa]|uniref:Uncharacterized protein n=1 Tax=Trematosphaeria pertusa TaxID=390896 RepID=A0A6A6IR17_9PLEO|nr:uncharacterized protein BU26DRAFT_561754 [Trematosphaeria pertusa]KAF2251973.1 hypothetical protein BU26DRAFT_561754 [Trematosphaeria pertusa]
MSDLLRQHLEDLLASPPLPSLEDAEKEAFIDNLLTLLHNKIFILSQKNPEQHIYGPPPSTPSPPSNPDPSSLSTPSLTSGSWSSSSVTTESSAAPRAPSISHSHKLSTSSWATDKRRSFPSDFNPNDPEHHESVDIRLIRVTGPTVGDVRNMGVEPQLVVGEYIVAKAEFVSEKEEGHMEKALRMLVEVVRELVERADDEEDKVEQNEDE